MLRRNKAQKVVKILDKILKLEANSASCMFAYEPKAPKELERFKKTK
ncbi:MAG: cyclic lactone autoinducer peptide [Clostridiales bacterium]|nr:cyclic lactone autoinducer peptide [Lachnospira sp.]MBS5489162.1 cyclic lactone autoinducer peptide [Clostridiales bacterium]OLA17043.1 MAG: cyclic lactone autoinducer peptide [Lachnospira eligens]